MAVYKNLLEQTYNREITPYIFAVTKESPPDIAGISIYPGRCEYCRQHKSLTGFLEVGDLLE